KGMMMVTILAAGAVAASLYLAQGHAPGASADPRANTAAAKADPLLGTMFEGPDYDSRRLYLQLRGERRDETWASRAEASLKAAYTRLPHAAGIRDLRVLCAATLCEVAGHILEGKPVQVNAVMTDLQDWKLMRSFPTDGMKMG